MNQTVVRIGRTYHIGLRIVDGFVMHVSGNDSENNDGYLNVNLSERMNERVRSNALNNRRRISIEVK